MLEQPGPVRVRVDGAPAQPTSEIDDSECHQHQRDEHLHPQRHARRNHQSEEDSVWPSPQRAPMRSAARVDGWRVTMVLTATTWSASVA